MNQNYPTLLSPAKIGNVELRNRTVMAAMGMSQSTNGFVNDAVVNHYAERARGGVGMIVVEVTCVDAPLGLNTAQMLVIDDDKYIPGMTRLASAIHEEGAKAVLQISHTGRGARRKITGHQPVGPSAVAMPYSFMMGLSNEEPRELTIDEIHDIEEKYAQAALRAKKAGFDGVEIHSVGYYMGQQFLSSTANIRTDEYGGNPENRVRFHLNIIRRIRELCGDDFAIIVKFSAVEAGENAGITMEDGMYYAKRFQDVGVDALEVLAGTWKKEASAEDMPTSTAKSCQAVGLCQALKYGIYKMTGAPATIKMIGGGRAQNPEAAEKALSENMCEFIFIGHGLMADPHLVRKIAENKEKEIQPCLGCDMCINSQLQDGMALCCSVNPVAGQGDNDYTIKPADKSKKVIVVGGGVAGVEAARIAAMRGHQVDLYEKSDRIGGQFNLAIAPPNKDNFKPLLPWMEYQLEKYHVNVHLNTEINADQISEMNPDVVICATGLKPAKLPITGFERAINAKEVLGGAKTGKDVVIIGGGSVGIETAELIAQEEDKNITIIEMTDTIALNMVNCTRTVVLGHLKADDVHFEMNSMCKEIKEDAVVYIDKEGVEHELHADTVIVSVGDVPNTALFEEVKDKVNEVYNIGDSNGGGLVYKAMQEGYRVALKI